jgi:hypothetical protein
MQVATGAEMAVFSGTLGVMAGLWGCSHEQPNAAAEAPRQSPCDTRPVTGGGIDLRGPPLGSPRHPTPRMPPSPPSTQPSPDEAPQQPDAPESTSLPRRWLGLDRLGMLQVLGGIALGLIALFSSYDHITLLGRSLQLQQQWGILCIAASLATVLVDAELASGSRLRAAHERARDQDSENQERNRADRERNLAGEERQRANQERKRAAEARERQVQAAESQGESLAEIRRAVFLSARVQLDPTGSNRARLQAFLTLMGQRPAGGEG